MRALFAISIVIIFAACKPDNEIRSGELYLCASNDGGVALHPTASTSWDVTGTITAVNEMNGETQASLDCAEDAAYAVHIQKSDGVTWTVAYGILDNEGIQSAPAPDVSPGDTVNLLFRQVQHTPPARGLVLVDGQGLVFAMDNGIAGGALETDVIDGLMVRRGLDVGKTKDDCGKRSGAQIEFNAGGTVTLEPYTVSEVRLDDDNFEVYAISSFYWPSNACDESADEMAWALFR